MKLDSNTTRAGLALVMTAIAGYLNGQMNITQSIAFLLTGVVGILAKDDNAPKTQPTQDDTLPRAK